MSPSGSGSRTCGSDFQGGDQVTSGPDRRNVCGLAVSWDYFANGRQEQKSLSRSGSRHVWASISATRGRPGNPGIPIRQLRGGVGTAWLPRYRVLQGFYRRAVWASETATEDSVNS
jgi:hypothetical protein